MSAFAIQWRGRLLAVLAGVLLAAGTAGAAQILVDRAEVVRTLVLLGEPAHVTTTELRDIVARHDAERLAAVDLDAVREEIEQLPWVARAHLARQWPDRLTLRIREHTVRARVRDGRVWTMEGEVLALEGDFAALPMLDVADDYLDMAWEVYQLMDVALAGSALPAEAVRRDARGSWTAVTEAGTELRLGKGDPSPQLKRLRDVVAPTLAGRLSRVAYVDMRYGNGFAVGWRDAAPEIE